MLTAADNELLTRTGADTPMGRYFRRYWQPVALSRELAEADGAPMRVKVMGENLVAFRNTQGKVGLVDQKCPHRGADLYFGRNEDCAIRCVFHGWKIDIQGNPIELPNVPPDSNYHQKIRLSAQPPISTGLRAPMRSVSQPASGQPKTQPSGTIAIEATAFEKLSWPSCWKKATPQVMSPMVVGRNSRPAMRPQSHD